MTEIHEVLNRNYLVVRGQDNYRTVRAAVIRDLKDFILLVDSRNMPARIISRSGFLTSDLSAIENMNRVASDWGTAVVADISVSLESLVSLLGQNDVKATPGVVILDGYEIQGIISWESLARVLSQIQVRENLEGTRFPDVFRIFEEANLPKILCYRCNYCSFRLKVGLNSEIPICEKPWHGKMILTSCES